MRKYLYIANICHSTGVISSTLVNIGTDLSGRELLTLDRSLVTASTAFFALIASPLAALLADKIGRKKVILLASLFFLLGALLQAWASTVEAMIAGRSVVGLAVGAASFVVPLWVFLINTLIAPHMEKVLFVGES